jgi:hypothetical protein
MKTYEEWFDEALAASEAQLTELEAQTKRLDPKCNHTHLDIAISAVAAHNELSVQCLDCSAYFIPDWAVTRSVHQAQRNILAALRERSRNLTTDQPSADASLPITRETQRMRGRPVTDAEADVALEHLTNTMFGKKPGATASVLVQADDDDVLLTDYLLELRERNKQLLEALSRIEHLAIHAQSAIADEAKTAQQ